MVQAIEKAQSLDPTVVATTFQNLKSIDTAEGPATIGGLKTWGINATVITQCPLSRFKDGKTEFIGFFPLNVP
jgi:hypothetical protein